MIFFIMRAVQAVGTTKKCYMLYNVEADESLTGGTFYSDQQLDSQFVETLAHICVAMLQVKDYLHRGVVVLGDVPVSTKFSFRY